MPEARKELTIALSCPTTQVDAMTDLHKLHNAYVSNALTQLDWARSLQTWAQLLVSPEVQRIEEVGFSVHVCYWGM